jgi:hypothetical protein
MSIQTVKDKRIFSRLRQNLVQLNEEISRLIKPSFSDQPLVKGSVYELKRKCGKPGCKCAKGHLHSRMVVSASDKGKTRLQVIPSGFLAEVESKVRRYQRVRRCRARLVEAHKKMLYLMDQMEAMRRQEVSELIKKPN